MIHKEAGQLLAKLNSLKSNDNGESKRLKQIAKNIIEYESKVKKWLLQFDVKISQVQTELKTLREQQLKQEQQKTKEIDEFELSLKKLLDSYSKQARNASIKLDSMVQSIKDQMRMQYKQNIQKQKASIERFKDISTKLQKLIDVVRLQQKKSIDDHESIKQLIRTKYEKINEQRQYFMLESTNRHKEMLQNLSRLQTKINGELHKLMIKFDNKVYQNSKTINYMVAEATNM